MARGVKADIPFGALNQTPLYKAVERNDTHIMQLLLDRGAGLNKRDDFNQTPLHVAAFGNRTSTLRLLLSRGAETNARDRNNKTPLDLARMVNHGEAIELLIEYCESVEKEQNG